jgi:hypothetical protein
MFARGWNDRSMLLVGKILSAFSGPWIWLGLSVVSGLGAASPVMTGNVCRAVEGAEAIFGDPAKRYFIVGERHGTAETPELFGDLACLASASGPLIVGLEMEAAHQSALDAYLASDGSSGPQAAWRNAKHWKLKDGRGSVAMWVMIDRLRLLRQQGRDLRAIAFMHQADTVEGRERAMADAWKAALDERPDAKLLILIGSVHAETEAIGHSVPAASFVPKKLRFTLSYVPWEVVRCAPHGCPAVASAGAPRILRRAPSEWSWPRYDAYYTVGRPFRQSPPLEAAAPR